MKNLFIYYICALIIPIGILYLINQTGNSIFFCSSLVIFIIYRYFIDSIRLKKIGVLKEGTKEYYLPLKSVIYFKELYFTTKNTGSI